MAQIENRAVGLSLAAWTRVYCPGSAGEEKKELKFRGELDDLASSSIVGNRWILLRKYGV